MIVLVCNSSVLRSQNSITVVDNSGGSVNVKYSDLHNAKVQGSYLSLNNGAKNFPLKNVKNIVFNSNKNAVSDDIDRTVNQRDFFSYPNPIAGDILHVYLQNHNNTSVFVEITDVFGDIIFENNYSVLNNEIEIDVSILPLGAYVLHTTSNDITYSECLIKL